MTDIAPTDARLALDDIDRRRSRITGEIGVPAVYWWAVAGGWVVLGIITDTGNAIAGLVATLLFGAVHAAFAPRLLTGRHRTGELSVRADLVGRRLPALLLAGLLVMAGVTVAASLLVQADGAGHPVTIASVIVGLIILAGGPALVAAVRRRAVRHAVGR
jgi:hypothetical protein